MALRLALRAPGRRALARPPPPLARGERRCRGTCPRPLWHHPDEILCSVRVAGVLDRLSPCLRPPSLGNPACCISTGCAPCCRPPSRLLLRILGQNGCFRGAA